jgi:molybdopterin converting factor small subunit
MVRVMVRMMGPLKETSGRDEEELTLKDGANVSSVIQRLIEEHGDELGSALLDPIIQNPLPNTLILLNGVEINNIQGLDTIVGDGDVLTLLSVTHSG